MNQPNTVTLYLETYNALNDFKTTIQSKGLVIETCRQTSYYTANEAHQRLLDDIRDYESRIQILESELVNLQKKRKSWFARLKSKSA